MLEKLLRASVRTPTFVIAGNSANFFAARGQKVLRGGAIGLI